jgi:hypothetical protein
MNLPFRKVWRWLLLFGIGSCVVLFVCWYRWGTGVIIVESEMRGCVLKVRRIPSGIYPPFGTNHEGHGYVHRYELWIAPHFMYACQSQLSSWQPGATEPEYVVKWDDYRNCRIYVDGAFFGMFWRGEWSNEDRGP